MDKFVCICGKSYAHQPSLARHHKTCNEYNNNKQKGKPITEQIQPDIATLLSQEQTKQQEQIQQLKADMIQLQEQINKMKERDLNMFVEQINTNENNITNQLCTINATNYIYLLQEREFTKTNEPVYKIGMTKKVNHQRFNQYPKGSTLIHQSLCVNCNVVEKRLISIFKNKFKQRTDIGTEYFEGDYVSMVKIINWVIQHECD